MDKVLKGSLKEHHLDADAGYVDPLLLLEHAQTKYCGASLSNLQRVKKQIDPFGTFHNAQSVMTVACCFRLAVDICIWVHGYSNVLRNSSHSQIVRSYLITVAKSHS